MSLYSVSYTVPKIPFRPDQCPNCQNYENKQCVAYAERKPLPFGTSTVMLSPAFGCESQEPCPNYVSSSASQKKWWKFWK